MRRIAWIPVLALLPLAAEDLRLEPPGVVLAGPDSTQRKLFQAARLHSSKQREIDAEIGDER